MNAFLILLILALATESTVQLLTKSEIFSFISDWAAAGDSFIQRLFRCGYCLSVWVSVFWCFASVVLSLISVPLGLVLIFPVHRLSNWLHHIFELLHQGALWIKELNEKELRGFDE